MLRFTRARAQLAVLFVTTVVVLMSPQLARGESQCNFEVSYTGVCWKWGWLPYPCTKTKTVTRWCYKDMQVKEYSWLVYCKAVGCERDGTEREDSSWCFNMFGTRECYMTGCFDVRWKATGKTCSYSPPYSNPMWPPCGASTSPLPPGCDG